LSKYRSKLRIISDILTVARKGAKRTQIMYQANLSYRLMDRYLREVLSTGLVNCVNGNLYVVTKAGEEFLSKCIEFFEQSRRLEREFNEIQVSKMFLEKLCSNNMMENRDFDYFGSKRLRKKVQA